MAQVGNQNARRGGDWRNALKAALNRYDGPKAPSGMALAKIADQRPQIIFVDIMMPRLDGYQTCSLIKKNPRFKATPVIMLSSKDGLFDRARGRMVGSDQYLTKPFTKDSLLQTVADFALQATGEAP